MPKLTRRKLIVGGLIGGALAVGYSIIPGRPEWNGPLADGEALINNWIKVGPDGTITVFVAQAEMGQGIQSGFATVLAEEMDADWSRMTVEIAPDHPSYSNIMFASAAIPIGGLPEFMKPATKWMIKEAIDRMGLIATGGSTSMRDKYLRLREAGALARMTFQHAAADMWDVPVSECTVSNHAVIHPTSGKRADFGELVERAAVTRVKGDIKIKPDHSLRYVGNAGTKRLDIPAKVTGRAQFGSDVRVDGMVFAALANGESSLGQIIAADENTALEKPGVLKVLNTRKFLAVVGETWWQAQTALEELTLERNSRVGAVMINDWQEKRLKKTTASDDPAYVLQDAENFDARFAEGSDVHQATYTVPYLAHACLETNNATAHYQDGKLTIWAPTQSPTITKMAVSKALDIDQGDITVHTTLLGGGFGRKAEPDNAVQVALIARELDRPVQLIWSRTQDMHGDMFRPAAAATLTASLAADGTPVALKAHVSSQAVGDNFQGRWMGASGEYTGKDPSTVEGLEKLPYDYGAYKLGYTDNPAPVTVGYWRSVGHSYTAYFAEAFADELARKAGEDPLSFRLERMNDPRAKAVLKGAAELAGYGKAVPSGRYQGIAFHESFGSLVAMVVEIAEPGPNDVLPPVTRVFAAVDVGTPINPDTIKAQIEGSVVFGLTAALYGEVKFDAGVPTVTNFDGYPLLSLEQTPDIEVIVLKSDGPLGGVGEPGVPPVAPALANAVSQWSGRPVRALPLISNPPTSASAGRIASNAQF